LKHSKQMCFELAFKRMQAVSFTNCSWKTSIYVLATSPPGCCTKLSLITGQTVTFLFIFNCLFVFSARQYTCREKLP